MPNIRWWKYPALSALYGSQGNPAAAARYTQQAQTQAFKTLGPLGLMLFFWGLLGLGGVALLLYQLIRRFTDSSENPLRPKFGQPEQGSSRPIPLPAPPELGF